MRVLHVVTHMNRGGLESMIMNYYRSIDRTKIQFDFLVHRDSKGHFDDEIESLGGIIYRIPKLNPFSIKYRYFLHLFFKSNTEYDIIHVHQDCMSSIFLKEAYKFNMKVRIAHSHNSNQDKNFKYPIKLFYKKNISKYATHLFACGSDAGHWMFQGAPFDILNNAIDTKLYSFDNKKRERIRNEFKISDSTILVGHIGRFSPTKNHTFLIDVFNQISSKIDAKLILVGDGDLKKVLLDKVNNLNLADKIIFTGVRSDISDILNAMDIFIFPSLYEGLPVTLVEAQANGLKCLISDNVPNESRITDLIYQLPLENDATKWAEVALENLEYERKDTYELMKSKGYDIEQNAKMLESFYSNSLKDIQI